MRLKKTSLQSDAPPLCTLPSLHTCVNAKSPSLWTMYKSTHTHTQQRTCRPSHIRSRTEPARCSEGEKKWGRERERERERESVTWMANGLGSAPQHCRPGQPRPGACPALFARFYFPRRVEGAAPINTRPRKRKTTATRAVSER